MRITESALRRIIRQEVGRLSEAKKALAFRFPADYPKDWRTRDDLDFPGDWDIAAETAVAAGVPMEYSRAYKEMRRTARGTQAYDKKINAYLVRIQREKAAEVAAWKAAQSPEPPRELPSGPAPKVRGTGPLVVVAQEALERFYRGEEPYDIVDFMVNKTAKRAPGSSDIVSDRSDDVLALVKKADRKHGAELEAAWREYFNM